MKFSLSTSGFTTLFAVLVASLLLGVGFAIFEITYQESEFSTVVRSSDIALYAADTGVECSYFWDKKYTGTANFCPGGSNCSVFATSTGSTQVPTSGIMCANQDIAQHGTPPTPYAAYPTGWTPWVVTKTASTATTVFTITLAPLPYCAVVSVEKSLISGYEETTVISDGYNTCVTTDPNRIERAFESSE